MCGLVLALLLVVPLQAATINVPCDFASISNAVMVTAAEGDTVQIGSGTCIWERGLVVDRNISFTITGNGTNLTTFYRTNTSTFGIWFKSSSTNVYVPIANCTVYGSSADTDGFVLTGGNAPSTPMAGPFHIYNVRMPAVQARGMSPGSGDSFGLIEYCYFETIANVNFTHVSAFGNEYRSWTNGVPLGTTNVVCVENCVFKTAPGCPGNGFFDAYNGAQLVLRHCTFDGTANSGAHGYDSQVTSTRTGELYANVWTNVTAATSLADWRGGTLLWFSNAVSAPLVSLSAIQPQLKYYRGCDGIASNVSNFVNVDQVLTWSANMIDGQSYSLIFQPNYVFKTALTGSDRQVKIGATLAESISNLVQCIQLDPAGSGTAYSAGSSQNTDVQVKSFTATSLTLTNILDGTNAFKWPGAFQQGVISISKFTRDPETLYPCYMWASTINGTNMGFNIGFDTDPCNGHNNTTNLIQLNRDYFVGSAPVGYTPLVYPHPLSIVQPSPPVVPGTTPVSGSGGLRLRGGVHLRVGT